MALSEAIRQTIEEQLNAYCLRKVPLPYRNQVRLNYKLRGDNVILSEEREAFRQPGVWVSIPIAQFRYAVDAGMWTLFSPDRNDRWHPYRYAEPARDLGALLHALDTDKTGIFWG